MGHKERRGGAGGGENEMQGGVIEEPPFGSCEGDVLPESSMMSQPPGSGPPRPWGTTAADGPLREKADRPTDVKVPSKGAERKRFGG